MVVEVTYLNESERSADGEYVVTADGAPLEAMGLINLPDAMQCWRSLDGQRTVGVMFWDADRPPLIVEVLSGLPDSFDAEG